MIAKLEPEFMPMIKVINDFKAAVAKSESQKVTVCVERNGGLMATYTMDVYKDGTGHDEENYGIIERIIKTNDSRFWERIYRCKLKKYAAVLFNVSKWLRTA